MPRAADAPSDARTPDASTPDISADRSKSPGLVPGLVALCQDLGGIHTAVLGIDIAATGPAPREEFIGQDLDRLAEFALGLEPSDGIGHPLQPVFVIGLEVGIEGQPARPVFLAHPGDGNSEHFRHLNKSPLV